MEIQTRSSKKLKQLKTPEGLRAAIIKKYYDLPIKTEIPEPVQIRNALAIHTIGEKFEAPKEKQLSTSARVPEKLALFLASRNLHRPRDIETSSQLLTLLAAEAVGTVQSDPNSLRLSLLRKIVSPSDVMAVQKEVKVQKEVRVAAAPEYKSKSLDLRGFSGIVHKLAKTHAKGWSGNKRAYISHVWKSIKSEKPELKLDESAFKTMLAEAHRAGHITLAIADLRDKGNISDIQDSVTRYKNTEWHFIRVDD